MTDGQSLQDLLLDWEERYERGEDVPAEELCRDRPEWAPALASRIRALKQVGWLDRRPEPSGDGGGLARERPGVGRPTPLPAKSLVLHAGAGQDLHCPLFSHLGEGSFGEVRSGIFRKRFVAVKISHGRLGTPSPVGTAEKELERLARLKEVSHPHILKIHHVEVQGGRVILVTELADKSLAEHFLSLGAASPILRRCEEVLDLLWQAADALDHLLLRHGLLHLDIKPANLLFVSGRCKLGDFGSVKQIRSGIPCDGGVVLSVPGDEGGRGGTTVWYRSCAEVPGEWAFRPGATLFTASGAITPRYAPPEAFIGKTSRSFDQYSLAVTFCELAGGQIPFVGGAGDQLRQRRKGLLDLGFLPADLRPAVARALSPDPEERFPSCLQFVAALRCALDQEIAAEKCRTSEGRARPLTGTIPSLITVSTPPASGVDVNLRVRPEAGPGRRAKKTGGCWRPLLRGSLALGRVLFTPLLWTASLPLKLLGEPAVGGDLLPPPVGKVWAAVRPLAAFALLLPFVLIPALVLYGTTLRVEPIKVPWTRPGQAGKAEGGGSSQSHEEPGIP